VVAGTQTAMGAYSEKKVQREVRLRGEKKGSVEVGKFGRKGVKDFRE